MTYQSLLETSRYLPRYSLQEMSPIKIMTTLCNNPQLLDLILECDFNTDSTTYRSCARMGPKWKAVKKMANQLVSQICNSVLLKKKILEKLWPVSYRILLWKSVYAEFISNSFLRNFYWTDRGRIDNTRTARCIIGDKNISVRKRFILACSVCLIQEIQEIWAEMSNDDKAYFREESNEKIRPLLHFWMHIMNGSVEIDDDSMENALDSTIALGLLEAIKYLIFTIPEVKRKEMAYFSILGLNEKLEKNQFLEEDENDMGYFLFFEISDEFQDEILDSWTTLVLSLLLYSSEYKTFINLLTDKFDSFTQTCFMTVLRLIFYTYHFELVINDDCRKLFIDVWRMIPISARKFITEENLGAEFLALLIRDNFPFVLEKEAFKKIAELTSSDSKCSKSVKKTNFNRDKWKFLLFLIEKVLTHFSVLKNFKSEILWIMKKREFNRTAWIRVLRFVKNFQNKNPQEK